MNLLFFTPDLTDACSFYRGIGPFSQLRREGVQLTVNPKEVNWATISGHDLAFMQRPFTKMHLEAARIIKRQMPLWLDYDDNLFEVPPANPAFATFREAVPTVKALLAEADILTVSTPELAEQLAGYGVEPQVIPNAWNDYLFPEFSDPSPKRTVLWRGTDTHVQDLLSVQEDLCRVAEARPDWSFVFMGATPWMLEKKFKLTWIAGQDIIRYHTMLRDEIQPAIQIVPLLDSPFNRAKSNIAWIESAWAGAVTLAPSWGDWRQPGTRLYGDDFAEQLLTLMGSADRANSVQLSQSRIASHYRLSQVNKLRLGICREYSRDSGCAFGDGPIPQPITLARTTTG